MSGRPLPGNRFSGRIPLHEPLGERAELYARAAVGLVEGAFRYYVRPEITAKRTWAAIGTIVVAHELLCPPGELLSEGADRAIEKHPWIPLAGAILLAHVVNAVDERYDLVHQAFRFIKPVV